MTSKHDNKEVYVWIWLPGSTEPVVAGKLESDGDLVHFNYGRSYLERKNAIPIYDPCTLVCCPSSMVWVFQTASGTVLLMHGGVALLSIKSLDIRLTAS